MSQICIFCGIIPEMAVGKGCSSNVYNSKYRAGDGGEDISCRCRLEAEHLAITEGCDGSFPAGYVDTFLSDLKCYFLEGLVFPRKHMDSRLGFCITDQSFTK